MKRFLLGIFLITLTGFAATAISAPGGPEPDGAWFGFAQVEECKPDRICAEWIEDGSSSGILCCIDQHDLLSDSFSACQDLVSVPRPPGNPL